MDTPPPANPKATIPYWDPWLKTVTSALGELASPNPAQGRRIAAQMDQVQSDARSRGRTDLAEAAGETAKSLRLWSSGSPVDMRNLLRGLHRMGKDILDALFHEALPTGPSKAAAGLRVLIVDDSAISAESLASAATSSGLNVRTASTLKEVREHVTSFDPNVLVSDVRMPNLDVKDLCTRFRSAVGDSNSVVVLISASPENELREQIDAIKPDAFACKLTGATNVITRVRAACTEKLG